MPSAKIDPFSLDFLKKCKGYDEKFIQKDKPVLFSVLSNSHKRHLPKVDGNTEGLLNYTNLSVWYNKTRKIPFVSAYNIDGSAKKSVDRDGVDFHPDPRFNKAEQLNFPFYNLIQGTDQKTEFEIGHMAAHNELAWGEEAEIRSFQTFHFPNSVPQGEKLNSGLWSRLESYVVQEGSSIDNKRISVFTGPMMDEADPVYVMDPKFQLPLYFFKLVIYEYGAKLFATAFVMSHYVSLLKLGVIKESRIKRNDVNKGKLPVPFDDYNHKEVFQVNIDLIENYTGLNLSWKSVERITVPNGSNKLGAIKKTDGVHKNSDFSPLDENSEALPALNMILRP